MMKKTLFFLYIIAFLGLPLSSEAIKGKKLSPLMSKGILKMKVPKSESKFQKYSDYFTSSIGAYGAIIHHRAAITTKNRGDIKVVRLNRKAYKVAKRIEHEKYDIQILILEEPIVYEDTVITNISGSTLEDLFKSKEKATLNFVGPIPNFIKVSHDTLSFEQQRSAGTYNIDKTTPKYIDEKSGLYLLPNKVSKHSNFVLDQKENGSGIYRKITYVGGDTSYLLEGIVTSKPPKEVTELEFVKKNKGKVIYFTPVHLFYDWAKNILNYQIPKDDKKSAKKPQSKFPKLNQKVTEGIDSNGTLITKNIILTSKYVAPRLIKFKGERVNVIKRIVHPNPLIPLALLVLEKDINLQPIAILKRNNSASLNKYILSNPNKNYLSAGSLKPLPFGSEFPRIDWGAYNDLASWKPSEVAPDRSDEFKGQGGGTFVYRGKQLELIGVRINSPEVSDVLLNTEIITWIKKSINKIAQGQDVPDQLDAISNNLVQIAPEWLIANKSELGKIKSSEFVNFNNKRIKVDINHIYSHPEKPILLIKLVKPFFNTKIINKRKYLNAGKSAAKWIQLELKDHEWIDWVISANILDQKINISLFKEFFKKPEPKPIIPVEKDFALDKLRTNIFLYVNDVTTKQNSEFMTKLIDNIRSKNVRFYIHYRRKFGKKIYTRLGAMAYQGTKQFKLSKNSFKEITQSKIGNIADPNTLISFIDSIYEGRTKKLKTQNNILMIVDSNESVGWNILVKDGKNIISSTDLPNILDKKYGINTIFLNTNHSSTFESVFSTRGKGVRYFIGNQGKVNFEPILESIIFAAREISQKGVSFSPENKEQLEKQTAYHLAKSAAFMSSKTGISSLPCMIQTKHLKNLLKSLQGHLQLFSRFGDYELFTRGLKNASPVSKNYHSGLILDFMHFLDIIKASEKGSQMMNELQAGEWGQADYYKADKIKEHYGSSIVYRDFAEKSLSGLSITYPVLDPSITEETYNHLIQKYKSRIFPLRNEYPFVQSEQGAKIEIEESEEQLVSGIAQTFTLIHPRWMLTSLKYKGAKKVKLGDDIYKIVKTRQITKNIFLKKLDKPVPKDFVAIFRFEQKIPLVFMEYNYVKPDFSMMESGDLVEGQSNSLAAVVRDVNKSTSYFKVRARVGSGVFGYHPVAKKRYLLGVVIESVNGLTTIRKLKQPLAEKISMILAKDLLK